MSDLDSGVQTVLLEGALLTAQLAAKLTQDLQNTHTERVAVVIDCQQLTAVTPDGLSALRELGIHSMEAHTGRPLALAGLSRPLTRVAIEVGLAECFAIYASVAAFARAQAREQARAHTELQRCAL